MRNRKPLMAANWKMNLSLDEARDLLNGIKSATIDFNRVDVLVAPPFTTLRLAHELLAGTGILIAGQNMHWESGGAFTGEISPLMLKEAGCGHVILGHSERRTLFFETSETVNQKVDAAIEAGLIPIVCIGETLKQREDKKTFDIIKTQLDESLETSCKNGNLPQSVIIAYEPVWAIGTGKTATPEMAQEVHRFIRRWLIENFGPNTGETIRILYGGSVKPDNIKELISQPDIDGALIGGASLKTDSFVSIIRFYDS
ncbi:MAG: triose-phosphate isomerase [Desulfobacterium sp. 4572_20]|nr:MAG: triose-phosphate isomerase [Desulfobacterium sp. 4572_20]RLB21348.1 MAG: triose-phosphate isomerase [Deltaproteobacteria bacterium]HDH88446.1 triose-phosphate isomerase [Desulfobacteraceae bacterium]